MSELDAMRKLSPRRNTTEATDAPALVDEQLRHFGIDPESEFGAALAKITLHLYAAQADTETLWNQTLRDLVQLERTEKIARFNAKKFLSFQLAKLLDTSQSTFRRSYQRIGCTTTSKLTKGPYPVFDNVTAIFSATPVIARTATYIYACAEWIEDAFQGRELLLEIYSRLLNPTSVTLANHIVDIEAGPYTAEYFAWNFSSGMAAIDGVLSHVLGRDDVLIQSRNIYGGAHQLIHDWYAKPSNLDIGVVTFDGGGVAQFDAALDEARARYADRFAEGRRAYLYLESPCNPHGYVLDVPGLCRRAHEAGLRVILDATVGTPFLQLPLQRADAIERPDFLIHSYTKDLSGTGAVIAGGVIGRMEEMFLPKGTPGWDQTMFWNVYYVKGAFLSADAAFEVIQGMRTLEVRMLAKCINTIVLARFLDAHPQINVHCAALPSDRNHALVQGQHFLGLPAPLFTIDMDGVSRTAFQRFFDSLAPMFGHMISLGQSNTIVSCPALTTHSELDEAALDAAGIRPTTIRMAVGDEDPRDLIRHFVDAARLAIEPLHPGFCAAFLPPAETDALIREHYLDVHRRYIEAKTTEG